MTSVDTSVPALVNKTAPGYQLVIEIDLAGREKKRRRRPRLDPPVTKRVTVPSFSSVARSEYPDPPGGWIVDAACKGQRMYYQTIQAQTNQVGPEERKFEKRALLICKACPVIEDCRTWAMQPNDPAVDHIAGGLTPRQRRDLRRLS